MHAPHLQPHKTAFVSVPGLFHARYKGEPDFVVGYDPNTPFHDLVEAIEAHQRGSAVAAAITTGPTPRPVTYWLECFACNPHDPLMGPAEVGRRGVRAKGGGVTGKFAQWDWRGWQIILISHCSNVPPLPLPFKSG